MELKQQDYSLEIQNLKKEIAHLKAELKDRLPKESFSEFKTFVNSAIASLEEKHNKGASEIDYSRIEALEKSHESLMNQYKGICDAQHSADHVPQHLLDKVSHLEDRLTHFTDVELEPTDIGCRNFFNEFLKARDQGFRRADACEKDIENLKKMFAEKAPVMEDTTTISNYNQEIINTLCNNVDVLKNQIADVVKQREQSSEKSATSANFEALEPRFEELTKQITGVQKNAMILTDSVAKTKVQLQGLSDDLEELKSNPTIGSTDNSGIIESIREFNSRLNRYGAVLDEKVKLMDLIQEKLDSVANIKDAMEPVREIKVRLDRYGSILDEKSKIIDEIKEKIAPINRM